MRQEAALAVANALTPGRTRVSVVPGPISTLSRFRTLLRTACERRRVRRPRGECRNSEARRVEVVIGKNEPSPSACRLQASACEHAPWRASARGGSPARKKRPKKKHKTEGRRDSNLGVPVHGVEVLRGAQRQQVEASDAAAAQSDAVKVAENLAVHLLAN